MKDVFPIYCYTCIHLSFYSVAIDIGKINMFYFLVTEQEYNSNRPNAEAALRLGLPDTGPPSLVFGPPSLLTPQVFWPNHFFVFGPPSFERS